MSRPTSGSPGTWCRPIAPILVTGSTGYLGSRIVELLSARKKPVIGVSRKGGERPCDLCIPEAVAALVDDVQADTIIHCAAVVPQSAEEYADDAIGERNLAMVRHLIASNAKHIVFASSMTVYDASLSMPVAEEDAPPPAGGYGGGKRRAELLLEKSPQRTSILRFPGLFGPPRREGLLYNTTRAFFEGKTPRLPATPPLWGAFHVEDAADLCIRAGERREETPLVINAGYPDRQAVHLAVGELAGRFRRPAPQMAEGPVFAMNVERAGQVVRGDVCIACLDFQSRSGLGVSREAVGDGSLPDKATPSP
ncbi:MAG: NAD(P)-dependent oxidoreductase [Alphaproteobacteria bacterium]|nr:NAD(P)-dependent oxidoreductase [Alphaproteobacteria bacterium]